MENGRGLMSGREAGWGWERRLVVGAAMGAAYVVPDVSGCTIEGAG